MMNGGKKLTGRKKYTNTPVLIYFLRQEDGGDTTFVSHFIKTLGNVPESFLFIIWLYSIHSTLFRQRKENP